MNLAELTTLRVGGPAAEHVVVRTEEEFIDAVAGADRDGVPVLLVGGGSNLVISDDGFPGRVVQIATRGITIDDDSDCGGANITVAAGESWDHLVAHAVAEGWSGIEALSGIPGLTGATPIQNVGAYGAEIADTCSRVRTWDRQEKRLHTYTAAECSFAYRDSMFKQQPGRWLVLSVSFQLPHATLSVPVRYAELARRLGVEVGQRAPLAAVREAVLALRAGKGMVLDPTDHDTWSAGSFFTNPVLTAEAADVLPEGAPRFPQADGRVKTSAAWLIQHAGFQPGHGNDRACLSTKHTLALTNRGTARAEDILALAREVRAGVADVFGVTLVPEPVLVGCSL